jgi:hypothetical protein
MENLDQQTRIINLGKALVDELKLEPGVDTISKWMAHYIAEKIVFAETLTVGESKTEAEKECFEAILKLWKHRWSLPSNKHSLGKFEPILKTLERLSPDVKEPYWYHSMDHDLAELEKDNPELKTILNYTALSLDVDKAARIWIEVLLGIAAKNAITKEAKILLNNAINLHDNDDVIVIRSILSKNEDSHTDLFNEDDTHIKYKRRILEQRIVELEKFSKLNNLLLDIYKSDLASMDNTSL